MKKLILTFLISTSGFAATAPLFQGKLIGGEAVVLKDQLKPGRALLVTFWATWCAACLEELKQVADLKLAQPSLPFDVLTVNVDKSDSLSDVGPTIKLYKIPFPVLMDTQHEIFARYQPEPSLPYSVLLDSQGNIKDTFQGYQERMIAKIKETTAK